MKLKKIAALLSVAGLTAPAFATNGMNMEGYGPIATGMGGASMAYDNGTAGLINNPATLGLMKSGTSRFDIAIGGLHPDVTTRVDGGSSFSSAGTAYYMPAIGYVRKDGKITWGIGMMSQGGMGTEYGKTSPMSTATSVQAGFMGNAGFNATGANQRNGLEARSELGVGRIIVPLVFDVADNLTIGGSVDYVWGGLDMAYTIGGAQFANMMGNAVNAGGDATPKSRALFGSAGGTMVGALRGVMDNTAGGLGAFGGTCVSGVTVTPFGAGACVQDINWANISFNKGTDKMTQQATTSGFGGNVGFTFKVSPALSVGAVYHAKTSLKDMTGTATMTMNVNVGGVANTAGANASMPVRGNIKVVNFQWPETYGIGLSYQASDKWQIVADYKNIGWANVMKDFHMTFTATDTAFAGTKIDFFLNQGWKNQSVVQLGAAYKYADDLTMRGGLSLANNPIPNSLMNPLFPATPANHVMFGLGYAASKTASIDASVSYAPQVTAKNSNTGASFAGAAFPAVSTEHSQTNWQLMFSNRF